MTRACATQKDIPYFLGNNKNSNQSIFLLAQPEKEFFNFSELQENQEYQLFAQPCRVDGFVLESLQCDTKKVQMFLQDPFWVEFCRQHHEPSAHLRGQQLLQTLRKKSQKVQLATQNSGAAQGHVEG